MLVCKPATERVRLHAALTWPGHSSSPGPPGLVTAAGAPQRPGSPAGEEKGKEKGLGLPPPRRALPSTARARTHTAEDRRCPPFATGCELQIKVPVLLGGERRQPRLLEGRGGGKGESSAARLPFPVQMIHVHKSQNELRRNSSCSSPPTTLSRSFFFFFFFKGGSARERLLVPRERTRTKNKAKSPSRDS